MAADCSRTRATEQYLSMDSATARATAAESAGPRTVKCTWIRAEHRRLPRRALAFHGDGHVLDRLPLLAEDADHVDRAAAAQRREQELHRSRAPSLPRRAAGAPSMGTRPPAPVSATKCTAVVGAAEHHPHRPGGLAHRLGCGVTRRYGFFATKPLRELRRARRRRRRPAPRSRPRPASSPPASPRCIAR